ncbi:hypothetical protein A0H81_08958 [Grifola frondosa]|uniref:Uncharacterized protein n=1 Tax=Grifola frondosa TaxID=5627 RepID=A0A1C7M3X1_GRIFR|nr:hypothetical protein A0H81_08958 [Grifola frondosa]
MPFPLNVTHLRLDIDLPDNPFKAISQHRDKEVEVMRVCKIFGRQLVSFALYWYIAPPSRPQVPSIVFEILHRCPALRFLAVNDVSGVHPHLVKEYPEKKGPQPYLESTLLPPPASTTLNVLHLGRRPFSEAGPPYTPDAFAPFEVLLPDCVVYHCCRGDTDVCS